MKADAKSLRVADRLHSAAIHLLRSVRHVDRSAQTSPARLSALSVIVFSGPVTLGDLARAEHVTAPTMSRLAADLEADGLIRRERDPADLRVTWLSSTAKGSRLLSKARDARVKVLAERVARLGPRDRATLAKAAKMIDNLSRG